MRLRFIIPYKRNRMMIRGPFTEDSMQVTNTLIELGYDPATFLEFWKHILFWKIARRRHLKKFAVSPNLSPEKKTRSSK